MDLGDVETVLRKYLHDCKEMSTRNAKMSPLKTCTDRMSVLLNCNVVFANVDKLIELIDLVGRLDSINNNSIFMFQFDKVEYSCKGQMPVFIFDIDGLAC